MNSPILPHHDVTNNNKARNRRQMAGWWSDFFLSISPRGTSRSLTALAINVRGMMVQKKKWKISRISGHMICVLMCNGCLWSVCIILVLFEAIKDSDIVSQLRSRTIETCKWALCSIRCLIHFTKAIFLSIILHFLLRRIRKRGFSPWGSGYCFFFGLGLPFDALVSKTHKIEHFIGIVLAVWNF